MRLFLPAFIAASLTLSAAAQTTQPSAWPPGPEHATVTLWPNAAPDPHGPVPAPGPEHDTTKSTDNLIAGRPLVRLGNVSVPTLTLYLAPKQNNTGAAVVVLPGGGYSILAIDLEGTEVCDWLNSIGVNCLLVKYRVPDSGPYPKSSAALQDAQRALGIARQHAAQWNIDPHRIGVLGFSAGAHLAAALSTHYDQRLYPPVDAADQQSAKPDFAFVIYPGYLALADQNFAFNADIPVIASTPPTFLVQAEDDPVHVENVIQYFTQLKQAGVPTELHVYAKGGHGYGLRPTNLPVTHWPELATTWLNTLAILPAAGK
ncbi:MAG TPA: alpha/beta hydrolase [Acidobacteriaceae bacterium]|jgi:acetyl esterase/lipase|nr:alpha/beta hydrolase [Acidobacteriaceae bacterium]